MVSNERLLSPMPPHLPSSPLDISIVSWSQTLAAPGPTLGANVMHFKSWESHLLLDYNSSRPPPAVMWIAQWVTKAGLPFSLRSSLDISPALLIRYQGQQYIFSSGNGSDLTNQPPIALTSQSNMICPQLLR